MQSDKRYQTSKLPECATQGACAVGFLMPRPHTTPCTLVAAGSHGPIHHPSAHGWTGHGPKPPLKQGPFWSASMFVATAGWLPCGQPPWAGCGLLPHADGPLGGCLRTASRQHSGNVKNLYVAQDLIKFENKETIFKTEELEYKYSWWPYSQIKDLFNKDKKGYWF